MCRLNEEKFSGRSRTLRFSSSFADNRTQIQRSLHEREGQDEASKSRPQKAGKNEPEIQT